MSDTEFRPTTKQAQDSIDFLTAEISSPAFFTRLAQHGIEPRTTKEAEQLYQLGVLVQNAQAGGQAKEAQEDDNAFLTEAIARLDPTATMSREDVAAYTKAAEEKLPIAKTAALVYAHMLNGGELDESEQADE